MRSSTILLLVISLIFAHCSDMKTSRATWYDDAGATGCGVDHAKFDTKYIVALNGNGAYNGGKACGRFLKATFGQACVGGNYDLTKGCQGKLQDDVATGKVVFFQVQDACAGEGIGSWCSDTDKWHIDMSSNTLAFIGKDTSSWDNRQVQWEFVNNPNYSGQMSIYFGSGGNPWWPKLVFTGLLNGISGVDRQVDGTWKPAKIIGINGLAYNTDAQSSNQKDFVIRVYDGDGNLYPGTFTFQYPSACGDSQCSDDTLVSYKNPGGSTAKAQSSPSPDSTVSSSQSASQSSRSSQPTPTKSSPSKSKISTKNSGSKKVVPNNSGTTKSSKCAKSSDINSFSGQSTFFKHDSQSTGNCGIQMSQAGSKYTVGLPTGKNSDGGLLGTYSDGSNCGRWVQVTLQNQCTKKSDTNCAAVNNKYSCLSFNALVEDSMVQSDAIINIDQQALTDMGASTDQNWQITWKFIDSPNYKGDIKIAFGNSSSTYWPMIQITNLKSGVSKIERQITSNNEQVWTAATMVTNVGQKMVLPADTTNTDYEIKVYDVDGTQYEGVYKFQFPKSCGDTCGKMTAVKYTKE